MSADSAPAAPRSQLPGVRFVRVAVVVLLAIYWALVMGSSLHKGISFDEGEQLVVGYDIWKNHDFRMEGANGDFIKRWATVPLLFTRPHFPSRDNPDWLLAQPYPLGYTFLYASGNIPGSILLEGRFMVSLLGLATGLLVFFCARDAFGSIAGVFALFLFVFSPNMLAYGGLVSTEMSVCLGFLGSVWSIWRLLHVVSWGRLLASLAFFALLVLAKLSVLVLLPITAVLVIVKLVGGRPLEWRLGHPRQISARSLRAALTQSSVFAVLAILHAAVGWIALWADYDFRYAASPDLSDPRITFEVNPNSDPINPSSTAILTWSRATHFLPEGFLAGVEWLLGENDYRRAFLNGDWKYGGWFSFFPYVFWAKSSPALLLLLAIGAGALLWRMWRRVPSELASITPASPSPPASLLYRITPFVVLILVYFSIAVAQNLNIGHRHLLPIYPACYVLAGGAAVWLWSRRSRLSEWSVVLLFAATIFDAFWMYPDYLAYFNPLASTPAQGYKHLVDSSLGWGTNLPALKKWLDVHDPGYRDPVFLAYFGVGNPEFTGIKARRLPGYFDWRPHDPYLLTPGIYAISATLLEGVASPIFGPWSKKYEKIYQECLRNLLIWNSAANKPDQRAALLKAYPEDFWTGTYSNYEVLRFCRLCAWLRHNRPPDANVGYSILIWRLSQAELDAALLGPPAELRDDLVAPIPSH